MTHLHVVKRSRFRVCDCELCGAVAARCRSFDEDLGLWLCLECEPHAEAAERKLMGAGCRQPDGFEAAQLRYWRAG